MPTPSYSFAHFAGSTGGPGAADGAGSAARFSRPSGVAVDANGNVFVADSYNYALRKITPAGEVTTFAGALGAAGFADGTGAAARFRLPRSLTIGADGTLYVADSGAVRSISAAGLVSTLAGAEDQSGSVDGLGAAARFGYIEGLAVDATGMVFASDLSDGTVRRITPAGLVSTYAGTSKFGLGGGYSDFDLTSPFGIAVNPSGTVFVLNNAGGQLRAIASNGAMTNLAGDYTATASSFLFGRGLSIDSAGNFYFAVASDHTIVKVTAAGSVSTLAGIRGQQGNTDGPVADARFSSPIATAVDSAGNVFVADQANNTVRKITTAGVVSTLAGGGAAESGLSDGAGDAARFYLPGALAVDAAGNLFVGERENRALRKVSPEGVVTTVLGPDAGLRPAGLDFDAAGNLYIFDSGTNRIYRMTTSGALSVFSGSGVLPVPGTTGDGVAGFASFDSPRGLTVAPSGTLYVIDGTRIRKVAVDGLVRTIAGERDQVGTADGVGSAARFRGPRGIVAIDDANIYVADVTVIRHIDAAGKVTTLAGSVTENDVVDGAATAARFSNLAGMARTPAGDFYVSDSGTIRHVTRGGVVTTLAGAESRPGSANGVDLAAVFNGPTGLAVDDAGNLYVADTSNHAIRKAALLVPQPGVAPQSGAIEAGGSFSLTASALGAATFGFEWRFNGSALAGVTASTLELTNVQPNLAGLYAAVVTGGGASFLTPPAIVGVTTGAKVVGAGSEVGADIRHANGNFYDQILLEGAAATITSDVGQVTRISCVDLTDDIIQVEFSGPGTLSLVLEGAGAKAPPVNYDQPNVSYVKGHAGIVITGATKDTHVSVFSVGRANAVNQTLFKDDVTYNGMADLAYIAILSVDGKFGGLRTANANYYGTKGIVGVYAPGVEFTGPVYVGEITAFADAQPMLVLGYASDVRVTGGDLLQDNGQPVKVSGMSRLQFGDGSTSHGGALPVQPNRGRLEQHGRDVTAEIVFGGSP